MATAADDPLLSPGRQRNRRGWGFNLPCLPLRCPGRRNHRQGLVPAPACGSPPAQPQPPVSPSPASPSVAAEDEELMCRYCFEGSEAGELISPCKCAGGQKYVHLTCLRSWQRTVLVSQPTHPDLYDTDTRQRICNVCKSEFTCPPPTRAELLTSFTGPELAGLIEEGCIIASAQDFSWELEQQVMSFPEAMREGIVYRNWVRGAFLIVKVVEDRQRESVSLRVNDEEDLVRFLEHLGPDARSFHLRGRRFSLLLQGPLREVSATATPDERRQAIRALRTPLTLPLRPENAADCGEDGIVAVNLTRPFDLARANAPHDSRRRSSFVRALSEAGAVSTDPHCYVAHFLAGPCEEDQASACVVIDARGKYEVIRDPDCLATGIRTAEALGRREQEQGAAAEDEDADEGDGEGEPAAGAGEAGAEAPASNQPAARKRRRLGSGRAGIGGTAAAGSGEGQVRLFVFWGYAGWSRCQLMGEIARGSWGLCRAEDSDVVGTVAHEVWRSVYPRLLFAPKSEMSESYSGQAPAEEERRRELRRMAIFHDLIRGRSGARGGRGINARGQLAQLLAAAVAEGEQDLQGVVDDAGLAPEQEEGEEEHLLASNDHDAPDSEAGHEIETICESVGDEEGAQAGHEIESICESVGDEEGAQDQEDAAPANEA